MAIGAVEKPQVKSKHASYLMCDRCPAPLTGTWGTREGGDPRSRDDDLYLCLKCAGLMPVGPAPQGYEGMAFISGGLLVGLVVALIKWLM